MHDAFKSYSFPLLSLVPLPLILLPTSPPFLLSSLSLWCWLLFFMLNL